MATKVESEGSEVNTDSLILWKSQGRVVFGTGGLRRRKGLGLRKM